MKLKNIFNTSLIASLLLSAGACSDDLFNIDGSWNGQIPDELTLTLVIPDPQVVNVGGTRAGDDEDINVKQINILLYDQSTGGNVISNTKFTSGWEVNGETITLTAPLNQNAKRVEIVVNAPASYPSDNTDKTAPKAFWVDGEQKNEEGKEFPILWGQAEIGTAITSGTMSLMRNTSMVTVQYEPSVVDNFIIMGIGVYGTSEEGSLGPDNIDSATGLPASVTSKTSGSMAYIPAETDIEGYIKNWVGETKTVTENNNTKTYTFTSLSGFYETPASYGNNDEDFVRVIIFGRYTDPHDGTSIDGYYVVALQAQSNENDPANNKFSETPDYFQYGTLMDMLRNHEYVVTISEVRADGWPTLEQAVKAKPDNRLVSWCEDVSPTITDIEANRDYYLGVGADVDVDYNKDAILDIVTTYPGFTNQKTWQDRLDLESSESWIHADDDNVEPESDPVFSGEDDKKMEVKLKVKLDENTESTPRYGMIRVRAGKLSREIYITQQGCPYSRRRAIILEGLFKGKNQTAATIDNYFGWIEGATYDESGNKNGERADSVQGMSAAANRKVTRRNGLHFPVVPLYKDVTYKIPKASDNGTATITEGSSYFTVDNTNPSYYIVKMASGTEDTPTIATGRLVIPMCFDGNTVNVTFPLYRTGIFHYLEDTPEAKKMQPDAPEVQRFGWYYYEVVKLGDTYVLDRDLGASSNQPYSKGSSDYKKNKSAIGGYFKVNSARWSSYKDEPNRREDQETVTHELGLISNKNNSEGKSIGRFVMPTEDDVLKWNLQTGTTVSQMISAGRVAENKIYFSKAGYYEGDESKYDMHCTFWTRTYLGGTQGLGVESNEYGYWYRYYDDMKSSNPENRFSNMSMARGAGVNGIAPDDGSVWRYMPLRLVWVDKDCSNPSGSTIVDHTVTDKMVIYFEDTENLGWEDVRLYFWNFTDNTPNWNSRPKMTKVVGNDKLWRMELSVPKTGAGIVFSNGFQEPGNVGQTMDATSIYNEYTNGNTVLKFTTNGQYQGTEDNNKHKDKWKLKYTAGSEDNVSSLPETPDITNDKFRLKSTINGHSWSNLYQPEFNYIGNGKWEISNLNVTEDGEFVIEGSINGAAYEDYYKSNTSTHNVSLTEPETVEYCKENDRNWKFGGPGNYNLVFDQRAMTLRVTKIYTYQLYGNIFTGSLASRDLTRKENTNIWTGTYSVRTGNFYLREMDGSTKVADYKIANSSDNNIGESIQTSKSSDNNIKILAADTYFFHYDADTKILTIVPTDKQYVDVSIVDIYNQTLDTKKTNELGISRHEIAIGKNGFKINSESQYRSAQKEIEIDKWISCTNSYTADHIQPMTINNATNNQIFIIEWNNVTSKIKVSPKSSSARKKYVRKVKR